MSFSSVVSPPTFIVPLPMSVVFPPRPALSLSPCRISLQLRCISPQGVRRRCPRVVGGEWLSYFFHECPHPQDSHRTSTPAMPEPIQQHASILPSKQEPFGVRRFSCPHRAPCAGGRCKAVCSCRDLGPSLLQGLGDIRVQNSEGCTFVFRPKVSRPSLAKEDETSHSCFTCVVRLQTHEVPGRSLGSNRVTVLGSLPGILGTGRSLLAPSTKYSWTG